MYPSVYFLVGTSFTIIITSHCYARCTVEMYIEKVTVVPIVLYNFHYSKHNSKFKPRHEPLLRSLTNIADKCRRPATRGSCHRGWRVAISDLSRLRSASWLPRVKYRTVAFWHRIMVWAIAAWGITARFWVFGDSCKCNATVDCAYLRYLRILTYSLGRQVFCMSYSL